MNFTANHTEYIDDPPLVTIITAVYNGEAHLRNCIDSIRNQSYRNIEYIIIDGGSTDGTISIIKENQDVITSFVSEKDKGISDAFNKGIAKANGTLVGLLNADDLYYPEAVEKVVATYWNNNSLQGVYYGNIVYFNDKTSYDLIPEIKNIWKYMSIYHPATFVAKTVYESYGTFSLNYKYAMDCELIHRFLNHSVPFIYVNERIAKFRLAGTSDKNYKKALKEFYHSVNTYNPNFAAKLYYPWSLFKKAVLNSHIGEILRRNRRYLRIILAGRS